MGGFGRRQAQGSEAGGGKKGINNDAYIIALCKSVVLLLT